MGWNRFRRTVLTAMQNAKDPSQVARAIAKAYDTAVKTPQVYSKETASGKRTIEITGDILNKHTVLKGNTSALATYINNQFRLQAFSVGILPPSLPTLIAQGFPLYWSGATLKPGLPPSLFAPGPILQMMVLNPGIVAPIPYPPAKSTEEFVEHIITLAKMHLFTISGQIIVQVGPTPTPFPWFGYKVVDERVKSSISENLVTAGIPFVPQIPITPPTFPTTIGTTPPPLLPTTLPPPATTQTPVPTTTIAPITTQIPATTVIPQTTAPPTTAAPPPAPTPFIFKIAVSAGDTFYIPYTALGTYTGTIDWGDGTAPIPNTYANRSHTYTVAGQYLITVSGTINGFSFGYYDGTSNYLLIDIIQWGTGLQFGTSAIFSDCVNLLTISAPDTPTLTGNECIAMFAGCSTFTGGPAMNSWNMTNVTDTTAMFYHAQDFNQNISAWNLSSVVAMNQMFEGAINFNQPIGSWNTTNVTQMNYMFLNATGFNQDISNWNVTNLTSALGFMAGKTYTDYNWQYLDAIYNKWSLYSVQPNVPIAFGTIRYSCAGDVGKLILTSPPNNWTITDGGRISDYAGFVTISGNQTIYYGESTSFTVTVLGGTNTYQWEYSDDSGFTWYSLADVGVYSGTTTATLTITGPSASYSGYLFRAQVYNVECATTYTTDFSTLTINCPYDLPILSITVDPLYLPSTIVTVTLTTTSPLIPVGEVLTITHYYGTSYVTITATGGVGGVKGGSFTWDLGTAPAAGTNYFAINSIASSGCTKVIASGPFPYTVYANPYFQILVDVTGIGEFTLPYYDLGTYTGTIDWGDGNVTDNTYTNRNHIYTSEGQYTITIDGTISDFNFGIYATYLNGDETEDALIEIQNWGTGFSFGGFGGGYGGSVTAQRAFEYCVNLTEITAADAPDLTGITDMSYMFYGCSAFIGGASMASWDTSGVTNMTFMFYNP